MNGQQWFERIFDQHIDLATTQLTWRSNDKYRVGCAHPTKLLLLVADDVFFEGFSTVITDDIRSRSPGLKMD
jgi:hypothetical protein